MRTAMPSAVVVYTAHSTMCKVHAAISNCNVTAGDVCLRIVLDGGNLCMDARMPVRLHVCNHVCVGVCKSYECMNVWPYVFVCMYIYVYVCM